MRLKWLVWTLLAALLLSAGAMAAEESVTVITGKSGILIEGGGAETDGQTVVISRGGRYIITGKIPAGQLVVKARTADVELVLSDAYIANPDGAALEIRDAVSCRVVLEEGTNNTLVSGSEDESYSEPSGSVMKSEVDLTVEGSGRLDIYGYINNGLSCDGTLTLLGGTLDIEAAKEGLKAAELVLDGAAVTVSAGNDGLEAEGDVSLNSGCLTIDAARDGIDAQGSVSLGGTASVVIRTDSYAFSSEDLSAMSTSDEATEVEEISFKVAMGYYAASDQYAALFTNDAGSSVWVDVPFEKTGSQNVYYSLDCPAGFDRFVVYRYVQGQTPRSTEAYDACTKELSLSEAQDIYTVSSIAGGSMTGAWSSNSSNNNMGGMGGGWMSWGNSNKRDYSCKGIKTVGDILLQGGTLLVECGDDSIHAGGIVHVTGGAITLTAVDDAIHADGDLTIDGGEIDILTAFEGLEGYNVYMNGGRVTASCLDDGTNAGVYLVMSGGELDLTLPSGDTDGVDANYAVWMTGGTICVRSNAMGGVAGTVDTGMGGITVNGGHLIAIGSTAEMPSGSSEANYTYFSRSLQAGRYILVNDAGEELLSFRTEENYSGGFICSEALVLGQTYRIVRDGETLVSWTQTTARQTVR